MKMNPQEAGRTAADALCGFLDAMEAAGTVPRDRAALAFDLAAGAGLIRFCCHGERKANGWAVLHFDGVPAGRFGNWRTGVAASWRGGRTATLSVAERAAFTRGRLERHAARLRAYDDAATRCLTIWEAAKSASAAHGYLVAKRMAPDGLRECGAALLVPMTDAAGRLWSLQSIFPDGNKRFAKDGRVEGMMWRRGDPGAVIALGEGVATMAAVHAATGLCSVAAFSAGNLAAAAHAVRAQWPAAMMILCADDDVGNVPNKGLDAANAAARVVGGLVARPPRPPGWREGDGWDFADTMTATGGAEAIRRALNIKNGGAR